MLTDHLEVTIAPRCLHDPKILINDRRRCDELALKQILSYFGLIEHDKDEWRPTGETYVVYFLGKSPPVSRAAFSLRLAGGNQSLA